MLTRDRTRPSRPSGELARTYGFTDIDGRSVPPFELPDHYDFEKTS